MTKSSKADGRGERADASRPDGEEPVAPWEPVAPARPVAPTPRSSPRRGRTLAPTTGPGGLTPAWMPSDGDPEPEASGDDDASTAAPTTGEGTPREDPGPDAPDEEDASIALARTQATTPLPRGDDAITPSSDPDQTAVTNERPDTVHNERFEPGETIPSTRYKVVEVLGEGGMGVVYEAEHLDIGRHVALKVLRSGFGPTSPAVRQFRAEARAASKIGSEHIADVFDFAELADGRLLFAMELLEGPDLAEVLADGPMTLERAIPILRQVCLGLADAHAAELVHRDIKPSNVVLVTWRGRVDAVKIVDFGVSTMIKSGAAADELAGTPYYVAPEIILGLPFDERVDQYSLGCMAFQMLVGRPPFSGKDVEALFAAHVDDPPPVPSQCREDGELPDTLDAIVTRCLAKKPRDRYASMMDLHAALCEAQIAARISTPWDDLPVPEVEADRRDAILRGFAELAGETVRPSRARWVWPVVALLALAAALTLWLWPSDPAAPTDEVTRLTNAARAAAAAAHYVYPTRRDPDAETAYGYVLALERLEGDDEEAAQAAAAELRAELAGTLAGLADDYWDQPGGKAFAVEYYKQALAFDPKHPTATARAVLTLAELEELRDKTENKSFEEEDLVEEPPMVIDGEPVAAPTPVPKPAPRPKPVPVPLPPPEPPPSDLGPPPPPEETSHRPSPAPPPVPKGPTARDLVRQAEDERHAGKADAAAELLSRALVMDPKNRSALASLSEIEFDRGNYDEAAEYAKRAVAVAPRSGANRIRLGDAYFRLGRYAEAKTEYEKAAELGHDGAGYRLEKVDAKLGG